MKATILSLVLAMSAGQASAAGLSMQLKDGGERTLRARNGIHAVDSRTPSALVRVISPGMPFGKRGTVRVLVMNLGAKPFTFGPGKVRIALADGTLLPEVPVQEFDKGGFLIQREMRRQGAVDARVKSGLTDLAGQTSSGMTARSLNPASAPGGAAADASAARGQDRKTEADALPGARTLDGIYQVLRPAVVAPNEASGGYLVFEIPKALRAAKAAQEVTIIVDTGGEIHRFAASLARD